MDQSESRAASSDGLSISEPNHGTGDVFAKALILAPKSAAPLRVERF